MPQPGPGKLGKALWEIMELYKDKPAVICGHIKNYTHHRLFYEGIRVFDGNTTKEPERIIWQGSEFMFRVISVPGAFDFDKVKLSFELTFTVEDKRDWGNLRIGVFDRCISYVTWNKSTEEAREERKTGGSSGGENHGIRIILDESTVGHPKWELQPASDFWSPKYTLERIMYAEKGTGQEKEIVNGRLRGQFQQAMDNGSPLQITKSFLSGLPVQSGYVEYELKDGSTVMKQRRRFQYDTVLDFGFRIADIHYGNTKWLLPHTDRRAFEALYGSREMRGTMGDVLINNELFSGQDPEYGVQKKVVVWCNEKRKDGGFRVICFRAKEGEKLDIGSVPKIYNE